jgi:inorganic pyrophosphatase
MPNFLNMPTFAEDSDAHVVVETPRGSRAKFAYNLELGTFTLSKSLLTGLTYPHDWGFVPSTKADDGDPLDIMVIHDAATLSGTESGLGRAGAHFQMRSASMAIIALRFPLSPCQLDA